VSRISVPLSRKAEEILDSKLKERASHHVVLQITDIQYERTPNVFYEVYLNLPSEEPRSPKSSYFVGNLSFFALKPHHGMPKASEGVSSAAKRDLDVTKVVSMLRREHKWNASEISVTFVPTTGLVDKQGVAVPVQAGRKASLGAITLSIE
jgi:hypothetical protein